MEFEQRQEFRERLAIIDSKLDNILDIMNEDEEEDEEEHKETKKMVIKSKDD